MTPQKLHDAVETLRQVSNSFMNLPECVDDGVAAGLTLADAALYLGEILHHLQNGRDAYEATLASARGEMLLPMPVASGGASLRLAIDFLGAAR